MFFILACVVHNIATGVFATYLPILLRELGYRLAVVGILLAIAEGAGILGPLLFGRLADRSGNYRRYISLAYFLAAVAALPLAFFIHPVLTTIFIILLSAGFRAALPLIDAMTTINLGEKGNYGKIRVTGSISFVCMVFFLQWIPVMRPNSSGNIAFWICITSILCLIVAFTMPLKYSRRESHTEVSQSGSDGKDEKKKSIWTPLFIVGLTSIALSRLAMTPAFTFFPLFLVEYMQWDAVGLMFGIAAISEIPLMFFSNRLIRRFGALPIIAFTNIMIVLRLCLYAVFPFKAGVILAQLLHSFCFGLFHPAAVAFVSNCVPPERRSFGMTLYVSLGWGIPTLIGNVLCGLVVDSLGYRPLFGLFTIFAILGAAIYFVYRSKGARE